MKKTKNFVIGIAIILMLSILFPLSTILTASAHTPPWEIRTFAYISVTPNPVGVGQPLNVVMWADKSLPSSLVTNDIKFRDFTLTITKPDNKTETIVWPIQRDPTSSQYYLYTPDQVGTYSFVFSYPNLTYTWSGTYNNDTFMGATSIVEYVTVQEEQIPGGMGSFPLPQEYWTRPIEGQNTDWYAISSNWLGSGSPQITRELLQRDGIAPNSGHIMWTKPVQDGGVVGGTNVGLEGNAYYMGLSYNARFNNPIIMYGRLYYELPYGNSGSGGGYICVDLRTGEEIWRANTTGVGVPSFGYLYDYNDGNQHGVLPGGLLYTSNFARAYEPSTGRVTSTNITNVPSGTAVLGEHGEHIRYTLTNRGSSSQPNWYLSAWNSSKMNQLSSGQIGAGNWYPGNFNASDSRLIEWNISIPYLKTTGQSIWTAFFDDVILGGNGTMPYSATTGHAYNGQAEFTLWAISLKPESRGQLLWMKYFPENKEDVILLRGPVDAESRVFVLIQKETICMDAYSLDDGSFLYTTPRQTEFDYYISGSIAGWPKIAYGKLYSSSYGGLLYCYDAKKGDLLWTYGNGGEGNSTSSGVETIWGRYPSFIGAFADGKVYTYVIEHSPDTPIYKGARFRCVNATTGEELWTLLGFGDAFTLNVGMAIADGYLAMLNCYDMQIYCVGKGPSEISVSASPEVSVADKSVLIKGNVIDISAGTKQAEQAARFPKGVPAVSDESMSDWMEYVYMQKPRPTDITGVQVTLSVIDSNKNYREIGTTTSDADGFFSYDWIPDIEGKYTLYATFSGSESYWPSRAVTAFTVDPTEPTPSPYPVTTLPPFETYIGAATAAIIIAIAIVGLLILRKKQ